MRLARLLLSAALAVPVLLAASVPPTPVALASGAPTSLVASSPLTSAIRLLERAALSEGDSPSDEVVVDPSRTAQTWRGVGAALTDASILHLRHRPDLLPLLFGDDPRGVGLDWVRLPLSATDMSTQVWSWRETRRGARPSAAARDAVRFLRREVLPLEPDLQVVASAWTAPPAYKSPRAWFGGELADVRGYARFLLGQARWLRGRGVPLTALTMGNEPGHAADYPTMRISDGQLRRLARFLGPRLDRLDVELWGLDHNWDDLGRLAGTGTDHLDAVALHCYGGRPGDAAGLPLPWLVTECTGTDDGAVGTFAWDSRHLVADAVAAGSTGLIMWNLVLSPGWRGAFGGCHTCRGLLTIDGQDVVREPEFFTLAHLRRAAPPGARVAATSATGPLLVAGFVDGRRVGAYAYNDSPVTRTVRFRTTDGSLASTHEVGPHEIVTWVASRS